MDVAALIKDIGSIRDNDDDYRYADNISSDNKKNFAIALKGGKIKEADAKKLMLVCIDQWHDDIIRDIATKLFDKKGPINWEKDGKFIDEVIAQLKMSTERPKDFNPHEPNYCTFFELFVKMLKISKQLSKYADALFGFIRRSLQKAVSESDLDLNIHAASFGLASEFPWKENIKLTKEGFHLLVEAVKKNPMLDKKLDLCYMLTQTIMFIFRSITSNPKNAGELLADVTDLVHFCVDEEWEDEENSDENSLAYEMLKSCLEDYLYDHTSQTALLKPNMDVIKRLWECDDETLQDYANNIMSSIGSNLELLGDQSTTLIDNYLSGKDTNLISSFGDMFQADPELFYGRLDEFMATMDGAESWTANSTLHLFWEMSKKKPEIFKDDHLKKISRFLSSDNECHMVIQIFTIIASKQPKRMLQYDKQLMTMMQKLGDMGTAAGTILVSLSKTSMAKAKEYMKFFWSLLPKLSPMVKIGLLWNVRQIASIQGPELLQEFKPQLMKMKDIPELKDTIQGIIDVMEGRTLENLAQDIEEQKEDIEELDERVTTNEQNIGDIKDDVEEVQDDINDVKWDVKKQEGRVDDLEEVVEDTVDKVEEIDRKTLSHAPGWSRDVSKLLNPEKEHDWRLLASRLGYNKDDIKNWATQPDPCLSMLDEWFATHKTREATFAILKALQEMNREDAAMIVENSLKNVEGVVEEDPEELVDPPPIFISYQWAHQQEVKLLKNHLEMAGYKAWMDIGQMGGGDKLFAKIDEGIRAAKIVICCVSEKYAQSPNCNREVNLSVTLGKPVIPLLMEKLSWPPPGSMGPIFGEYLFIRFFQRAAEATKDSRYWPVDKFQELLMQLRYTMVPDEALIGKEYKGWWDPPEEMIVIKPKEDKKTDKTTAKTKSSSEVVKSPDVFISYQWGKQPQIKVLYRRLSGLGLSCWLDIMQMGGGDSLYDKIDKGIRGCKVVISCITTKYGMSANCRREVSLADAIKKPIVPLLLEKSSWPPEGPMGLVFTQLLYINFTKPDESVQNHWKSNEFNELLMKIGNSVSNFDANHAIGTPKAPVDEKSSGKKLKGSGDSLDKGGKSGSTITKKSGTGSDTKQAAVSQNGAGEKQNNDAGATDKDTPRNSTSPSVTATPRNSTSPSASATPRPETSMKKKSGICDIL